MHRPVHAPMRHPSRLSATLGLVCAAGLLGMEARAQTPTPMKYPGCDDLTADQFRKVSVLDKIGDPTLAEPVKMAFLPDGRLLVVERRGPIKLVKPGVAAPVVALNRPVFWEKSLKGAKIEDGTLGIAVDPGFATNGWVYVFYSPVDKAVNRLSRYTMQGDAIQQATEKILLEVPVQRDYCCHTGGGMAFDAHGNLFLTTGDNTASEDAYGAINEKPDMTHRDAQRSSGNTNDLRGKLLRIKPTADGKYIIPAGNLKEAFAHLWPAQADKDKVRPEIYSMGHRNPYTLFVDKYTGWAHIAEVGPDADSASADKGPAQHEELNLVKEAGNFGWPFFMGNNLAYKDWDYVKNVTGPAFNPAAPVNASVNNTGARNLPPARPAVLSRAFGRSGKGSDGVERYPNFTGTSAITGPVYYYDGRNPSKVKLPPHFDRRWIATDWSAGIVNAVSFDAGWNNPVEVARTPITSAARTLSNPVAMEVGPDGALYFIEYGPGLFTHSGSTRVSRIEYTGTCHPATPVPPNLPTALGDGALRQGALLAPALAGSTVRLPAGVPGFTVHDLRGKRVWEYRRGASMAEETVDLPMSLGRGLLKIRYRVP